jgi:hypothetical protein
MTREPNFTTSEELNALIKKNSEVYFENLKKHNIKTQIDYNPWDLVNIKSDDTENTNDKNATG